MSFAVRNLSVLAYANGFTLWHYKADGETLPVLTRPGYFDDAVDMLATGDMVLMSARDGGRMVCMAQTGDGIVAAPLG